MSQWARETKAGLLGLNQHVSDTHSKFMLVDPLSDHPIVVTGSAHFCEASVKENDESMLLVRGQRRTADIYLTEFNRNFNHYYFRSITEATSFRPPSPTEDSRFLVESDEWQKKHAPGSLKAKRLGAIPGHEGFQPGLIAAWSRRNSLADVGVIPRDRRGASSQSASWRSWSRPPPKADASPPFDLLRSRIARRATALGIR